MLLQCPISTNKLAGISEMDFIPVGFFFTFVFLLAHKIHFLSPLSPFDLREKLNDILGIVIVSSSNEIIHCFVQVRACVRECICVYIFDLNSR